MNKPPLWLGASALLATAALLVSCQTPSAPITVESYPHTQITVNSKVLGGWLEVVECTATNRNDLLQVMVTVQNKTQKDVQFEYRYRWLSGAGMEVGTPMSVWTPVSAAAREKTFLRAIAPSKEVADYVLDVRFYRSSTRW